MAKLTRLQTFAIILIALLGAALAALSFFNQLAVLLMLSILLGAFWCAIVVFGKPDLHLAFFVAYVVLLSLALLDGVAVGWVALLLCIDIAAWNLGEFSQRALAYPNIPNHKRLENLHLKQLGIPLGIGLALAVLPSMIRVELPFAVLVILVIAAVVLVGVGIRGLREKKEKWE